MATDDRLTRLVAAVLTVAGDVDLPTILQRIVEAATELAGATYGALGVIGDDHALSEFVYTGLPPDAIHRIGRLPEGHGILGLLIDEPATLRLPDLSAHPQSYGFPDGHPAMRSFLGTPVRVGGQVFGNLYLTEKRDGDEFSPEDEELVVGLAAVAGSAIERARLHEEVRRATVVEDRERIGRDLHDTVIQRLFATGLGLQAVASRHRDRPELAAQVHEAIDGLDETIREIRSTIFHLQSDEAVGTGLRRQLLALAREAEGTLGFVAHVGFTGPVDTAATATIVEHVPAVLREALTNVAKHADATRVDVRVAVEDGSFLLEVSDDGVGLTAGTKEGFGLPNLRRRAAGLGGDFVVEPSALGGIRLRWRVPLEA